SGPRPTWGMGVMPLDHKNSSARALRLPRRSGKTTRRHRTFDRHLRTADFLEHSQLKLSMMRRELRGIFAALLMIAATTIIAVMLRHYAGILRGSVLYLIPVMLLGYNYGVIPALI